MSRATHARAILGKELYEKLPETRILIVGAGGIGCELVKNVVLAGFGDVTLLDLDTIDLSNLNRQFLFRKKDVKQSKALVAARTVSVFNPSVKITPIHGNIKDDEYDVTWFKSFRIVLNALDNLDARRHVNRMCMAAQVPLIESGTAGYLGQVQPIVKDATECFDCVPKETPKSFPVCTIRSTPSIPLHCIVWAKSYLLPKLFGEDEDDSSELDAAAAAGENASEIASLREEASAFKFVRASMLSSEDTDAAAANVFTKVFTQDIQRLLTMSDMWKSRKPPVPLERAGILDETFLISRSSKAPATNGVAKNDKASHANGNENGSTLAPAPSQKLKDQRDLSLKDNLLLFDASLHSLASRLKSGKETAISFDKDDEDTLDFVTATANLRSWAYGIPPLTRWDIKQMAGNIIPAIATTNAIVSGLIVLQALHILRAQYSSSSIPITTSIKSVFIQNGKPAVPLGAVKTALPNPQCSVCRETYVSVQCDPARTTLGTLVDSVLDAEKREERRMVAVYESGRVLCDPDWDDNVNRTLVDLSCGRGKFITIVDDDEKWGNLVLAISLLPSSHPADAAPFILPSDIPALPPLAPRALPSPPASPIQTISSPKKINSKKRAADNDDEIEISDEPFPAAKRAKTSHSIADEDDDIVILDDPPVTNGISVEQIKEDKELEDEGLVIIDKPLS